MTRGPAAPTPAAANRGPYSKDGKEMRISIKSTLSLRSNFAANHLQAAADAAREAYSVEQKNLSTEFGPWFDDMMRTVPVSVIMAGAALEASANELVQDILDGITPLNPSNGCRLLLKELKDDR